MKPTTRKLSRSGTSPIAIGLSGCISVLTCTEGSIKTLKKLYKFAGTSERPVCKCITFGQ